MRRIAMVAVLLGALISLSLAEPASACSCRAATSAEHFRRADAVFLGDAIGARLREAPTGEVRDSAAAVIWTFHVTAAYKGNVTRVQEVVSSLDGASCGAGFRLQHRYVVHAGLVGSTPELEGPPHQLESSLCDGSYEPDGVNTRAPDGPIVPLAAPATSDLREPAKRQASPGVPTEDIPLVDLAAAYSAPFFLGLAVGGLLLTVVQGRRRRLSP